MLGGTSHRGIPLAAPAVPRKICAAFFPPVIMGHSPLLSFGLPSLFSIEGVFSTYDRLYTPSSSTHIHFLCFAVALYSIAIVPSSIFTGFVLCNISPQSFAETKIAVYHPSQQPCADFQSQQPYLRPSSFCRRSSVPNPTALMRLWLDDI